MERTVNAKSRLFGLLTEDRDMSDYIKAEYLTKLSGVLLSEAEMDMFSDALTEHGRNYQTLLMKAVWDIDRNRMHVMTKAYPYCGIIMVHKSQRSRGFEKELAERYQRLVTPAWANTGKEAPMPDEAYQRIASLLNADYLTNAIFLSTDKRLYSELDMMERITLPLIKHEGTIQRHLDTVLDAWQEIRTSRGRADRGFTIDAVLDLVDLLEEFPGSEERVLSFCRERGTYQPGAVREYLDVAPALGSGVI